MFQIQKHNKYIKAPGFITVWNNEWKDLRGGPFSTNHGGQKFMGSKVTGHDPVEKRAELTGGLHMTETWTEMEVTAQVMTMSLKHTIQTVTCVSVSCSHQK